MLQPFLPCAPHASTGPADAASKELARPAGDSTATQPIRQATTQRDHASVATSGPCSLCPVTLRDRHGRLRQSLIAASGQMPMTVKKEPVFRSAGPCFIGEDLVKQPLRAITTDEAK
jgi:hypothetical protein